MSKFWAIVLAFSLLPATAVTGGLGMVMLFGNLTDTRTGERAFPWFVQYPLGASLFIATFMLALLVSSIGWAWFKNDWNWLTDEERKDG